MSIAYLYDGGLYLAVTHRCTLACTFCPKVNGRWTVAGNDMQRDPKPSADDLLAAAEAIGLAEHHKVSFVGLGEPTLRLSVVVETGKRLRASGHSVRVVTDGLASLRAGHNVSGEFAGAVDEIHVSLNAADAETYARLCPEPLRSGRPRRGVRVHPRRAASRPGRHGDNRRRPGARPPRLR